LAFRSVWDIALGSGLLYAARTPHMFGIGKPKNPEEHRYYLLPGQGRGARRKHRQHLMIAWVVGIVAASVLGLALWFLNQRN